MSTWSQAVRDLAWLEDHGALAGAAAVIAERRRQVEYLGYTPEHDRAHPDGWLAHEAVVNLAGHAYMARYDPVKDDAIPGLAASAAMVAAEIDRLAGDVPEGAGGETCSAGPSGCSGRR